MRVTFMGTPEFAKTSLAKLYDEGFEIVGVFTQPDRPKNRGMKLSPSPVKSLAVTKGTPVFEPSSLREPAVIDTLRELRQDIIAVVAYGKLLPTSILGLPKLGCVNIHGSLLPKYRGSAPVQWSVLNGDEFAGVTSMYMAEELDAGDMIFSQSTRIGEYETSGELFVRLSEMGAQLLVKTLHAINDGTAPRIPQDDEFAAFAPPLRKDDAEIDWSKGTRAVINHIRGLNPWPVARTTINGTSFKVYRAMYGESSSLEPGSILRAGKDGLAVSCGNGVVIITELQAPGGKRMSATEYFRGHPL